jgi:lipopolysaccharide/colanic/teichoic acid biosynthesis glycosyltransferase
MKWPTDMDLMIYLQAAFIPATAAALSLLILLEINGRLLQLRTKGMIQGKVKAYPLQKKSDMLYKRWLDLILVIPALILLSPIFLLISLLIKLDSPGPVLYKQKRVGAVPGARTHSSDWHDTIFDMYKFRTMYVDTDQDLHRKFMEAYIQGDTEKLTEMQPEILETATFKLTKDARVTRVGKVLRKFSLDELPQFWNVLMGDMSLIGPRPAIPYEVGMYKPEHLERLAVIPGITGLWQVSGRTTTTFEEMVQLDLEYIKSQSLWLDLKIIFLTLPAIISSKGAG